MSVRFGERASMRREISSLEPLPGRMKSAGMPQYSEIVCLYEAYSLSG